MNVTTLYVDSIVTEYIHTNKLSVLKDKHIVLVILYQISSYENLHHSQWVQVLVELNKAKLQRIQNIKIVANDIKQPDRKE